MYSVLYRVFFFESTKKQLFALPQMRGSHTNGAKSEPEIEERKTSTYFMSFSWVFFTFSVPCFIDFFENDVVDR